MRLVSTVIPWATGNWFSLSIYIASVQLRFFVRLEQVGIVSKSTMIHAFQTFAKGWRKVEPEPIEDCDCEMTNRFDRLCYRALSEDMISLPKAAELLRKTPSEIREEVRGPSADEGHS